MVLGALVGEGALNVDAELTTYVPVLANSGYAGATVRHLLDMRSGIAFSEDYLNPMAEVRLLEQAIGWAPRTVPDVPTTMYDYLLTLRQKSPHGGPFQYRSCETDVLGWICEAASGIRIPELMSQLLWGKLGADTDATIGVDSVGTGMFDGGINACLRDLARFGSLFLNGGVSLTGDRVVSLSWIVDTFDGGVDSRAAFAASPDDNRMPGGMYRNLVLVPLSRQQCVALLGDSRPDDLRQPRRQPRRGQTVELATASGRDQAVPDHRGVRRDRSQFVLRRRFGICLIAPLASAPPLSTRRRFLQPSTSGPWPPAPTRRPYAVPSAGRCRSLARTPPR
jgi:CubicO group peptidase (beta-lactamase class C family)